MSTEVGVALIVFAGGALTLLGNWWMNRSRIKSEERKTSGDIATSDAASLWAESNALRAEYKERAEKYEIRLQEVNDELAKVTRELTRLRSDSVDMEKKIKKLTGIIEELRKENQRLLALKKGL